MVVHNETSTGVASDVRAVRRALDDAQAPCIASGGHGLVARINGLSSRRMARRRYRGRVAKGADAASGPRLQRGERQSHRSGQNGQTAEELLALGRHAVEQHDRLLPYTPATNLLFGLREALCMLEEEGLENVFRRHLRLAEATRRAVGAWGLELLAANPAEYSPH